MQYNIVYTRLAKNDIKEAESYISATLKNPKAALDIVIALEKAIKNLEEFPYSHRVYVPHRLLEGEYRFIPVKNYLIFYTVDEEKKTVEISRVIYAKRDI